ncbi:MAG: molybdopterin-dependent oxidoreductase [Desulfosalsimonas sp.]|uniref:molybdopterin-containing oxidoreductase family protein n=1 Tax=Desulfosalsimonas sp. TaxID=3073848 RepID=UPI003970F7C7
MDNQSKWHKTHCSRMDHGGCALNVKTKGGKITGITGDPEGFLNQGYSCPKGRALAEIHESPHRLKTPLIRTGPRGSNQWRKATWPEALDATARGLDQARQEHGARSAAFCQGMPKGLEHFALIRLANTFGSPNVVAVQDVCHAPRELTGRHMCGFYPVADVHRRSDLIVLWGSNTRATNEEGIINSQITARIRRGADLMVIDPRKTALAGQANFHVQLRPGTDCALALGFLHVIIEEGLYDNHFVQNWCTGFEALAAHVKAFDPQWAESVTGVDKAQIISAARAYGRARPACTAWGNAVEQTPQAFDTIRCIVSLMAVCGNLDVPGGNIRAAEPRLLAPGKFVRADLLPDKRTQCLNAAYTTSPMLMTVPPAFFRRAVLDHTPYPVRAAYMQCTNPMLSYADSEMTRKALLKLDFLAVADVVMTPTAALADVVLPAATAFEFDDIGHYGLGHGIVLARPKLVDPPGQCRPDMAVINDLGRRLTDPNLWFNNYEQILESLIAPSGHDWESFVEKGFLTGEQGFRLYEKKGFSTRSGRVELAMENAEKLGAEALPQYRPPADLPDADYPLLLTSAKSPNYLHSSYRWIKSLRRREPVPEIRIHPDTAKSLGITNGSQVRIETRKGSIVQTALLTPEVSPEVVCAVHGWWFLESGAHRRQSWQAANFNMLTSANTLGRQFGTPRMRAIACRIRPA